jgi:hypothetical protein
MVYCWLVSKGISMNIRLFRALAVALPLTCAVLAPTAPAFAQAAAGSAAGKATPLKDAKKEQREERKELKEALKTGDPAKIKEAREELQKARKDRRQAAKTVLEGKYGADILKKPAVRAELRMHSVRMARLHHIEKLAKEKSKEPLAKKAATLIEKENARHQKRMDALKAKNGDDK